MIFIEWNKLKKYLLREVERTDILIKRKFHRKLFCLAAIKKKDKEETKRIIYIWKEERIAVLK